MTGARVDDVTEVIREQHQLIRALFGAIASSPMDERKNDFRALVRLLAVHETAEEMVVYPALRTLGAQGERVANARMAEEDEAKKVLARLEGLPTDSGDFGRLLGMFHADVERHASAEEVEVLPLLDRTDADGHRAMARAFLLAEDMAPTHAHGMAPESAFGNLLTGPFLAMMDKVRDAIRHRSGG